MGARGARARLSVGSNGSKGGGRGQGTNVVGAGEGRAPPQSCAGLSMPQSPVSSNMPIPQARGLADSPRRALREKMRQQEAEQVKFPLCSLDLICFICFVCHPPPSLPFSFPFPPRHRPLPPLG